ncbi:hypothetical protein NP493_188g00015 [Ridgeia piscesae]|uniref:Uncharacterized protein n=1 Tax=Ridgeia piscesae TaxID=27915 RepID=A0AAD9P230_RIDPI|nr:hypothetical protein NP493_188g00015 [Ridgeia piscesae]
MSAENRNFLYIFQGDSTTGDPRSITQQDVDEALPWIEKYHEKIVAIGEIGLDFTPRFCKTDEDKASQKHALTTWVEIGKKYNLPLSVHSRSAGRPTIALLKETGACNVLLHAFDGRPSVALQGVKAGYYFSIPPSIVRSDQKQKLVESLPLESLLLETDCPALGPEKQVRNEPSNIRLSCEYIARIKKVDIETVAQVMWENSLRLFPRIKKFVVK